MDLFIWRQQRAHSHIFITHSESSRLRSRDRLSVNTHSLSYPASRWWRTPELLSSPLLGVALAMFPSRCDHVPPVKGSLLPTQGDINCRGQHPGPQRLHFGQQWQEKLLLRGAPIAIQTGCPLPKHSPSPLFIHSFSFIYCPDH